MHMQNQDHTLAKQHFAMASYNQTVYREIFFLNNFQFIFSICRSCHKFEDILTKIML